MLVKLGRLFVALATFAAVLAVAPPEPALAQAAPVFSEVEIEQIGDPDHPGPSYHDATYLSGTSNGNLVWWLGEETYRSWTLDDLYDLSWSHAVVSGSSPRPYDYASGPSGISQDATTLASVRVRDSFFRDWPNPTITVTESWISTHDLGTPDSEGVATQTAVFGPADHSVERIFDLAVGPTNEIAVVAARVSEPTDPTDQNRMDPDTWSSIRILSLIHI